MLQILGLLMLVQTSPSTPSTYEPISDHARLDRKSGRPLEVRVTYPKQPGRFPLIVFSHGFRGSMDSYDPLIKTWVSHGYVCIQPNHADSYQYYKGRLVDLFRPSQKNFSNWDERPAEISMVLDRLGDIEKQIPGLADHIDRKHIGVGGHSFGAHTSELIGGATIVTGRSLKDPRASAVLLISPSGVGGAFGKNSFQGLTGPILVVTGSEDTSITPTTPEQRRQPFDLSPVGDKYLLWSEGAHHGMGGISGRRFPTAGPDDPVLLKTVQTATVAFWDLYLKQDAAAKAVLRNDTLSKLSKGASHLERR